MKAGLQTDSDEDENPEYRIKEELKFITDGHGIDIEQFSQMLIKECIKVILKAINNSGFTLIKTQYGYELQQTW